MRIFLLILGSFLFSACCTLKQESEKCECKKYNRIVKKYWVQDPLTKKSYIDVGIVKEQIDILEMLDILSKCWIGLTPEQVKKIIPAPHIVNGSKEIFLIEASKGVHDCRHKRINCEGVSHLVLSMKVQFRGTGLIKRSDVAISNGSININLYDTTLEELLEQAREKDRIRAEEKNQ